MENNNFEKLSFLNEDQLKKLGSIISKLTAQDAEMKSENSFFYYGNCGFKGNADNLDKVLFRVLVGTYIKSLENNGLPLGIMITASHNKYIDNGFQIAGVNGEPISSEWKAFYNEIVNIESLREFFIKYIDSIYQKNKLIIDFSIQSSMCFSMDTRPSSKNLFTIIKDTLLLLNSRFTYYEILPTSGLHFLTLLNQLGYSAHKQQKLPGKFSFFSSNEYWTFLSKTYIALEKYKDKLHFLKEDRRDEMRYENNILIDCANGNAAFCMDKIKNIFADPNYNFNFINTLFKNYSFLNEFCGSHFLFKEKCIPINYPKYDDKNDSKHIFTKNISFNGDLSRVIYL